jgi:hypothetical protein
MREKGTAELLSGYPNWGLMLSVPVDAPTEADIRLLEGAVDDLCRAPDATEWAAVRAALTPAGARAALVRLASCRSPLLRADDPSLPRMVGEAKVLLRMLSAVAAAAPDPQDPLRLGRIAGRTWILDALLVCGFEVSAAEVLWDDIRAEAASMAARDADVAAWVASMPLFPVMQGPARTRPPRTLLSRVRALVFRLTKGRAAPVPIGGPSRRYLQWLSWSAAEGRDPDWMLAAWAVIRQFEDARRPKGHRVVFHWTMYHLFGRLGVDKAGANISSTRRIGLRCMTPDPFREMATHGIHIPPDSMALVGRLEGDFARAHRGA